MTGSSKDMVFTSEDSSFKQIINNTVKLTVSSTAHRLILGHDLGFTPVVEVFVRTTPNNHHWYPNTNQAVTDDPYDDTTDSCTVLTFSQDDRIYVNIYGTPGETYYIKVFLFEDSIGD